MTIYKNKITILVSLFIFISANSCSGNGVVEIDDWGNWSEYVNLDIIDNTLDKDGTLFPEVSIEINKVADIEIQYLNVRFDYDYGYQYFSKSENIIFELDSKELQMLNNGDSIIIQYKYESCEKIEIEGYNGLDYDIYNPPSGSLPHVNPIIMYGLKIGAMVKKLRFKEN